MNTRAKFGDMIAVHFVCRSEDGMIVDSSDGRPPLQLTIGKSGLIRGFERACIGMSPGEHKTVVLRAEEAFGPYQEELKHIVSRESFPAHIEPEVGMQIRIKQENEEKVFRVVEVTEATVTLDANHEFAGKDLTFDVTLVDIIKPGPSSDAYFALGATLQEQGFLDEARDHYHDATEIDPDFTEAWFRLGVLEQVRGNADESIKCYRRALSLRSDHVEAMINLGNILRVKGEHDEALALLKRAAEARPDHASTYNTLGAVYKDRDDLDTAIAWYRKAIDMDPQFAEALNNLGVALREKAHFAEAEEAFRKAVVVQSNLAEAHFNLATVLLLSGNFSEGWEEYEWRLQLPDSPSRHLTKPWKGEDVSGKSILLLAEQGFGDTIQFIRYAPLLAERGGTVFVACQRELITLFEKLKGISRVFDLQLPLPASDLQCHLLSLPRLMTTDLNEIPSHVPYISAEPSAVERWRQLVSKEQGSYRIGLAWSGDPAYRNDRIRSLRPEQVSPLLGTTGTVFFKLHKNTESGASHCSGTGIVDYTPFIQDFADAAACIQHLDLVISVDTSIAHLAGAMGKPVWTLLPFVPDWRWMLNREDTPWYPTMRLFRQTSPGDWESVINRVADELKKTVLK